MKVIAALSAVILSASFASAADEAAKDAPVKVEQAEKQLAAGVQILDVRTPDEWNQGHLKDAKLVTVTQDGFLDKAKAVLDPKTSEREISDRRQLIGDGDDGEMN